MKTFKPISLLVNTEANFTPSALMRRWAKEHNKFYGNGNYFEAYIIINGKLYVYDHYEICYYDKNNDLVTLYLTEKEN